jgi:hypothetical protein
MRRPKGRYALVLLGVLVALLATAVVFAATRGGDFTIKVSSAKQPLTAGRSASFPVTVKRTRGFKGVVKVSVSGLPRGANAASRTVKKNQKSATITIATSAATPAGTFKPTITAKSGRRKHSKKLALTITAAAGGGAGGGASGTGGPGTQLNPGTQAEPTFAVNATPSTRNIPDGDATSYNITIDRSGGYTGTVDLGVTGEPATGSATLSPASTPGNGSTLTIDANRGTTPGTYDLVVTGTGGGKTASTGVALIVVQSQDFSIAGTAPAVLTPGGPARPLDLQLTNSNDFAIVVDTLGVTLTGTGDPGCLASWFPVTQYSGPRLTLPTGTTNRSLTSLGATPAQLPKVAMSDAATNQDVCKGKTLTFGYYGTATR